MIKNLTDVKNLFLNRTVGFYCGLAGAAVSVIGSILLVSICHADPTFTWLTFVLCLLGGFVGLVTLITDFAPLPMISAVMIAIGMANHLANGAYSLMNIALGSTFYEGNEWMVIGFFIVYLAAFVLLTIASYTTYANKQSAHVESFAKE